MDHEKTFSAFAYSQDAFTDRSADTRNGAMALVRPDQHIAYVLPLEAPEALADFLKRVFI